MDAMIRRAAPEDAPALHRLAAATFPLACPPELTADDQRAFIDAHLSEASFLSYLADTHRVVLVDEIDDALVGYTMLVLGPPTDADVRLALDEEDARPIAELSKCYVLPTARIWRRTPPARRHHRDRRGLWRGADVARGQPCQRPRSALLPETRLSRGRDKTLPRGSAARA